MSQNPGQPKILMLNSSRGFIGGVERLLISMAMTLKQNNWLIYGLFETTVTIDPQFDSVFEKIDVVEDDDLTNLIKEYKESGISTVCIHKTDKSEWIRQLRNAFKTVVIVHDHDYYCLRRHKYYPVIRKNCHWAFSLMGCSLCSGVLEKRKGKLQKIDVMKRYRVLQQIRQCALSFVLSDYMRQNLIMNGWKAERIKQLIPYQPVATDIVIQNNPEPVVLYIGQLIRGKGVDLLLKALTLVPGHFKCMIVGQGNDQEYLENLSQELSINDKVEFKGWVSNTAELYNQADIVVVPSRWQEPFGLVGLEAFAYKKPVVAFNNGGISQWLKHKVNGLLVIPNDYYRLSRAINLLINDNELRSKLGSNGYNMVLENHNFGKYSDSLLQPLQKC